MVTSHARATLLMLLVLLLLPIAGCQAIEGIFKAGVWAGLIFAVIVIALVGYLVSRLRG